MHQTAKNCLGNVIDTVFWMEKFVLLQKVGRVNTSKNTKNYTTKNSNTREIVHPFKKIFFLNSFDTRIESISVILKSSICYS